MNFLEANVQPQMKLWTYILSSDFQLPTPPTNEIARGGALRLWRWLQRDVLQRSKEDGSSAPTQRAYPSSGELGSLPLQPDWSQAAETLAVDLSDWFDDRLSDHGSVRSVIGPPGCDVAKVLRALAQKRRLKVLNAPSSNAILEDFRSQRFNPADESGDEILVIPHLERFFLRHEDGMTLVRNLTEWLMTSRRVLLGCDSWAWAFLQEAIGIEDTLGKPMTLAPFDAQALDRWLRPIFALQDGDVRQKHDNEPVFPKLPDPGGPEPETSVVIKTLAARSRGNPAVALALLNCSLHTRDPNSTEFAQTDQSSRFVIWMVSPSEIELPELPARADHLHRFILHALLLHAGLRHSSLMTVLPFSSQNVQRRVGELRQAGLVQEHNGMLRVSLTAYPNVRQDLAGEGFLTDAF